MLKRLLSKLTGDRQQIERHLKDKYQVEENGLSFSLSLVDDSQLWALASWLEQLAEEDYLISLTDRWLLSWEALYCLLEDEDHASSLPLIGVPEVLPLRASLCSRGALSDSDFRVWISQWATVPGRKPIRFSRLGAILTHDNQQYLLSRENWALLQAIEQLSVQQIQIPGETTNQLGWAAIRKCAKQAGAKFDDYLEKTHVVKPTSLSLRLRKATVADTAVIEIEPHFEDQPANWLSNFDKNSQVHDSYRIPGENGELSHVILAPEVKEVLNSIHSIPGRRVAGSEALSFVRNPYAFLGEDAASVIAPEEHEKALFNARIFFHHFRLIPQWNPYNKIADITLVLEPISPVPQPEITFVFSAPWELEKFVQQLSISVAAQMPAGSWQGYELELSQFTEQQWHDCQALLARWQQEIEGKEFSDVLDIAKYGDRVIGIGEFEKISSPWLTKAQSENWLPDDIDFSVFAVETLTDWQPENLHHFDELQKRINQAEAAGETHITAPWNDSELPLYTAKIFSKKWGKKQSAANGSAGNIVDKPTRAVLKIEQNIEEAAYIKQRRNLLLSARNAEPEIPLSLKEHIRLKDHQREGLAWLQQLFIRSPEETAGCLLADDMGLGKTLQILSFLVWFIEKFPQEPPSLIVAPVSLLDNWERELDNFFYTTGVPVLKLYGETIKALKYPKQAIPAHLQSQGIKNLLKPGWQGESKIVLTTYETLRDQEFSLARQSWSIMVCDEAQKIKNPAALITHAANAVQARFKVACTGTPVENTLVDLWSLFDFAQPGLLGALNEFGKHYVRSIENEAGRDTERLETLRALIEPQTLRRTKEEVARDLPRKIEVESCKQLIFSGVQKKLYLSSVANWQQQQAFSEEMQQAGTGMLGLLHKLKLICAHPAVVDPAPHFRDNSPKLNWLLKKLAEIKATTKDKVIIFTELRDLQRELQHAIYQKFGFRPVIINGDTSTKSHSQNRRQRLIDNFQSQPGFGIIILSTVAVGFGVNVQKANHVIHFTRCWNPAKEDQATDRAYRIGQTKDVYVYYPTVRDPEITTFEVTLDELLKRRRALAKDMLCAAPDLNSTDFEDILKGT
ncbi:ATP-dependent helicase [Cronobacter sakazakii]|uniref:type I Zorya anti-phage system protein ZorD n=1 Tax=Cronobacter sakazakii TaxID=28141 RepID=UPI001EC31AC4|nr:type I Zorya anti-phage system protein ZorD [Cronobacter sakazakii]EGT4441770.1 ATP-dependent helicase [Cronobacter sakazakii]UNM57387.1 DEAD/DEAH box helicase [Cronobacter sakazakii]